MKGTWNIIGQWQESDMKVTLVESVVNGVHDFDLLLNLDEKSIALPLGAVYQATRLMKNALKGALERAEELAQEQDHSTTV